MHGTRHAPPPVEEQQRDAVGRGNANADALHVGHYGIGALERLLALSIVESEQLRVYLSDTRQMHLVRHQQLPRVDAEQMAQRLAVFLYGRGVVATIVVDVECSIVALAVAPMSGAAEGHHACS